MAGAASPKLLALNTALVSAQGVMFLTWMRRTTAIST
jgi:hypothetical protein